MTEIKRVPPKYGTGLRLVIGDLPSHEDASLGEPFSDGAGRVLQMLYRKAGVKWDEVTKLTLLDHIPADGKFPRDIAVIKKAIRDHVLPVLLARPWQRADVIGEEALKYLCGKREGLFTWRGSPLDIDLEQLENFSIE